jgi:tRNA threonylcarbamoyladenosine biosynthesis protein TsaB
MALILNIETATALCSVALAREGTVIAQRETLEEKSHASKLTVFIEEILKEENINISDLDAIAVGKGPGSYTGLRIGISSAKGLCYGANIPLLAVSTLDILFTQVIVKLTQLVQNITQVPDPLYCPMIDARRMEVFTCLYNREGHD